MRVIVGIAAMVMAAGCLQSEVTVCGDHLCAPGQRCSPSGEACVRDEQLDACATAVEGALCAALGTDGVCRDGVCEPIACGNGEMDPGEACDDGDNDSRDGCSANCLSDESCGNGSIDVAVGEECDCGDGSVELPGCNGPNSAELGATCRLDCTTHVCGDGVVEVPEECEAGQLALGCADFGFYQGVPTCDAACRYDVSTCSQECGDDVINAGSPELCDGAPPPQQSCLTYGFDRGILDCTSFCTPAFDDCGFVGFRTESPEHYVQALWGTSADDVWAGAEGTLLHWDGATWSTITAPINQVQDLWGTGSDLVYAAGDGIAKWDGATWTEVLADVPLNGISGSGPDHVIAVGQGGAIRQWDGTAWTTMVSGTTSNLYEVYVASDDEAFAVGQFGTILHLSGGAWTAVPWGISAIQFWGVIGDGADDVIVLGEPSTWLHYDGASWSEHEVSIGEGFREVAATSTSDVFIAGPGPTALHYDGTVLHPITLPTSYATAIGATPDGAVFVGGADRLVYRADALWLRSWVEEGDHLWAVGGTSPADLLAVGWYGTALHYDGRGWSTIERAGNEYLLDVWGDLVVGFTSGTGGVIERWDGATLIPESIGGASLRGVHGSGANDVWAVGVSGTIRHFDGTTWSAVSSSTGANLEEVWASSPTDAYAVGSGGAVVHWNGTSWSSVSLGTTVSFADVWGTAANDVWVIGGQGGSAVYHWDGTSWTQRPVPGLSAASLLTSIAGTAPDDIYLANSTNKLAHWDGLSWSTSTTSGFISGLWADASTVIGVGLDLAILRRDTAGFEPQIGVPVSVAAMYGTGPDDAFVAARDGLYHYDGELWSRSIVDGNGLDQNPYVGLWGSGPDDWFAVSQWPTIDHWNGATWEVVDMTAEVAYLGWISGTGPDDVWTVGDEGAIFHWGADHTWTPVPSGTTETLWVVHAFAPDDVIAAGDAVLRYDGVSWNPQSTPISEFFDSIWASGPDDIYLGSGNGGLVHWNGVAWTEVELASPYIQGMWGTAADDVFVVAGPGRLFRFDGTLWSEVEAPGVGGRSIGGFAGRPWVWSQDGMYGLERRVPW